VHPDAKVELVEGGGGDFLVDVDGRRIWNKREMGNEFPDHDVILQQLEG
jgi:predicted Rdx family selenoprotein